MDVCLQSNWDTLLYVSLKLICVYDSVLSGIWSKDEEEELSFIYL